MTFYESLMFWLALFVRDVLVFVVGVISLIVIWLLMMTWQSWDDEPESDEGGE